MKLHTSISLLVLSAVQLLAVGPGPASVNLNCATSISGLMYVFGNQVILSGPAPTGGLVVTLTSSNPAIAAMGSPTITIPAGQTSGVFTFRTVSVPPTAQSITLTATANGMSAVSPTIWVGPISLSAVQLEKPTLASGVTTTANKVVLTGPAPAPGVTVALSTTNTAAQVPASVVIPTGYSSTVFTIKASTVSSAYNGNVKAVAGSASAEAPLTVAPLQMIDLVHTLGPNVAGGTHSIIRINLSGPAPAEGAQIAVTSSNPTIAPAPATVPVSAGYSFTNITTLTNSVSASTPVTITANFNGQSLSTVVTVRPARLSSVSLSPTAIRSGATTVVTVALDGPAPSGGFAVTLSSSNNLLAPVPANVVIPVGATSTTFSVKAGTVTTTTAVTLNATGPGGLTKTATLTINP